jgi:signal peptidase I
MKNGDRPLMAGWEERLVLVTESFLTWRKRRVLARKLRQKKRGVVRDWVDALLSAVVIVLLINQYFIQAYQIPSGSMEPTLQITDRLFVNKLVYGPELIPTMFKLPGLWQPERGDVIIFESPEYISKGPVADIIQRIVYMITLSLVDTDKDENGKAKVHFLVKRVVGLSGDRVRMEMGDVEILTPGAATWMRESDLRQALGLHYMPVRSISPQQYSDFREIGTIEGLRSAGLPFDASAYASLANKYQGKLLDDAFRTTWKDATRWAISPDDPLASQEWRLLTEGYYVPEQRFFPMGDNRDNSYDGRYLGPVRVAKVLGKVLFRYWPLTRMGTVE